MFGVCTSFVAPTSFSVLGSRRNRSVSSATRRNRQFVVVECRTEMRCSDAGSLWSPLSSLEEGSWFKLICGASSHDAPSIHNLAAIYTAVGADCVDVACDRAIIRAAHRGIQKGLARRQSQDAPLLMVSVNAGTDPHFRKAFFNPEKCPADCPRPCEFVCPADAINVAGVVADRCYGCGRCIPVCPLGLVDAIDKSYGRSFMTDVLASDSVDAVEIHVGTGQDAEFRALWDEIGTAASELKVVAVSLPNLGSDEALENGLRAMWDTMSQNGKGLSLRRVKLVWQADGRPMSGDIGSGTAHAAVNLGVRIRAALNRAGVPGEVQLAGGTNDATVPLMEKAGLKRCNGKPNSTTAAGIAVGGYARKIVRQTLEDFNGYDADLGEEAFMAAMQTASKLVSSIKGPSRMPYSIAKTSTR